eukprot:PhF_6_TR21063/c0_g1_i1/m.30334/K12471/EPN; epsin
MLQKLKGAVYRMNETELKTDEACNDEPWGPSGKQMQDLSDASYDRPLREDILRVLFKKFEQNGKHWRQCYKALLCLEFIAKNGDLRAVQEMTDQLHCFKDLAANFHYKEGAQDHGLAVRERAKKIVELLTNNSILQAEREKAGRTKEKYTGVGSNEGTVAAIGVTARNAQSSSGSSSKNSGVDKERQEREDYEYALRLQREEESRNSSRNVPPTTVSHPPPSHPTTTHTVPQPVVPQPAGGGTFGGRTVAPPVPQYQPQPVQQQQPHQEEWSTFTAPPPAQQQQYQQPQQQQQYQQPQQYQPQQYQQPQQQQRPQDDFDIFAAIHPTAQQTPQFPPQPQPPQHQQPFSPQKDDGEDFFAMRSAGGAPSNNNTAPPLFPPTQPVQQPQQQQQKAPAPADKFNHLVNLDNLTLGSTPGFRNTAGGPPKALNEMRR